jgi:L-malate glycosyltransferase
MDITILAPSDKTWVNKFLPNYSLEHLPEGYAGAPYISHIVEYLLSQNHTVTLITTSVSINKNYTVSKFTNKNFTWLVVPERKHSFKPNGLKLGRMVDFFNMEIKTMTNLIKSINPQIVHAWWSYEFAGAAIRSGYPTLITPQDNPYKILIYFKNLYRFFRLIMAQHILSKAQYISITSPYLKKYINKFNKPTSIIPNPTKIILNETEVETLIKLKSDTLQTPKIIMINNGYDARKNIKKGLLAFKEILTVYPNATLHLYGTGSEAGGPANLDSNNINLTNVCFYGNTPHNLLLNALKDCHIMLHPSLEESFGVILIEAMSYGVPAIGGLNSGAVPWVINEPSLLTDVTNHTSIAKTVLCILSDGLLYYKLSTEGYQNVVNRFSSKVIANEYLSYYQQILAKNKP